MVHQLTLPHQAEGGHRAQGLAQLLGPEARGLFPAVQAPLGSGRRFFFFLLANRIFQHGTRTPGRGFFWGTQVWFSPGVSICQDNSFGIHSVELQANGVFLLEKISRREIVFFRRVYKLFGVGLKQNQKQNRSHLGGNLYLTCPKQIELMTF